MENNPHFSNVPSSDNRSSSSEDYLLRAASAVDSGDRILGIHLYLAAFEQAMRESIVPSDGSLKGMDEAWKLALTTKQRSLAEYIFEKLEPFWTPQQVALHAEELQRLAFDKLEEFGLPREAIEDMAEMAEMVNQDFMDSSSDVMCRFEDSAADNSPFSLLGFNTDDNADEGRDALIERRISRSGAPDSLDRGSDRLGNSDGRGGQAGAGEALPSSDATPIDPDRAGALLPFSSGSKTPKLISLKARDAQGSVLPPEAMRFDYRSIAGYDTAIESMAKLGVGRDRDPEFRHFIHMLNERHGMAQMPSLGTLVFRCPAREDANYFMVATVGEMRLPAIRMRFDQNAQGQPVLCVMASPDFKTRISGLARSGFDGPAVLILEDLDLWNLPVFDIDFDDFASLAQVQLSRGAREALGLIYAALENPEVTVFISASDHRDIDGYFADMIASFRVIDIDLPDDDERRAIWRAAQSEHPSLRGLDVNKMVPFSKNMSRFEIFAVTTEAVEDAYRDSLAVQSFRAVHTDDMLARLAGFQPLDSSEYRQMEDWVVEEFSKELGDIDDLLKG